MEAGRPQAIVLVQTSSYGGSTWVVAAGGGGEKWSVQCMWMYFKGLPFAEVNTILSRL